MYEGYRIVNDTGYKQISLEITSEVDAALKDAAAVAIGSDWEDSGADRVVDAGVEEALDHVVAVQVGD